MRKDHTMRSLRNIIAISAAFGSASISAQLSVGPQTDLQQLAESISGPGVRILAPTIDCHSEGYGEFAYTGGLLGVDQGVLLTSGRITNAIGPNNQENRTFEQNRPGNAILNTVTGRTTYDACKFEFDIIPSGDSISFNFVLGSEEYNEWVGSQYNDVFGFFISGPGISGDPGIGNDHNIALVPGTSQAVTINNVNNGSNQAYFHDNAGGSQIQYDGITRDLKAVSAVTPCVTYHLKLIVADASDRKYDSGVFIERIESNSVTMQAQTVSGMTNMVEGCNAGIVRFTRQHITSDPLEVPFFLQGTATNGVDYPLIGTSADPMVAKIATIPANQAFTEITIDPIADGMIEPIEMVKVYLGTSVCPGYYIDSLSIGIQDSLFVAIDPPAIICSGSSTQLHASGGQSYAWMGNGLNASDIADPIASPATTTSYSVTISAGACTETLNTAVTVSNMVLSAAISRPLCQGGGNGAINLSVAGGAPPYTFAWTGPNGYVASVEDPVNIPAGTYTVTVTDAAACTRTQSFVVSSPAALAITTTPSLLSFGQNIACFGASTGSIALSITGGTGPYAAAWSGPDGYMSTAQSINGLAEGTYNVTVTDANGCSVSGSRTLIASIAMAPSIDGVQHVSCFGANNGTATVNLSGGMPPYTFAWNTTPVQTGSTATGLAPGGYTVIVTDAYGCTSNVGVTIDGPTQALTSSITGIVHVGCFGSSTGSATVVTAGGTAPYAIAWNTSPEQTTATASGLSAGPISVTITDANNCTSTSTATINGPAAALSVSIANVQHADCGGPNGSAQAIVSGGTPPYSYAWDTAPVQTTAALSGVVAGTYTITVTDGNGCQSTNSVTITAPATVLSASIVGTVPVACYGNTSGEATLSVSGGTAPYTIAWNTTPAQNGPTATGLVVGDHTATISDANGCMAEAIATITGPAQQLSVAITGFTNVLCFETAQGTADAQAAGGTAPYDYAWNSAPPQTGPNASDLEEGTYSVVATDANGCTASTAVSIGGPQFGIHAIIESYGNVSCFGSSDGFATLTITGGSGSYTVVWDTQPAQTGLTATGLAPGMYTATIEDNNGCDTPKYVPITILGPAAPMGLALAIGDFNGFAVSCADGSDGSIDLTVSGGNQPYNYTWSDDHGNSTGIEDLLDLDPGAYHLTVTDAYGCSLDTTVTLSAPPAIELIADVTTAACQGSATGAIDVTASGGIAPYTTSWNGPNGYSSSSADINDLEAGVYTLTITDANGCILSRSFDVSEPGTFTATAAAGTFIGGWNVSCASATDGSIDVSVTGGTGAYQFSWAGPNGYTSSNEDLTQVGAGSYTLTITDENGCSTFITQVLAAPAALTATLSSSLANGMNISCNGAADGTINATVTGGTAPYSTNWSGPNGYVSTSEDIGPIGPGTYVLTVADANGCSRVVSTVITEPAPLSHTIVTSAANSGDAIACAGSAS
ncbi:MAG: choice-of-anchor L domain-containing protein, partial [Flavobacteriales bacterium]|nr:choice-of-anchor L domain-containing protein [Flavobacteriales bacterium]